MPAKEVVPEFGFREAPAAVAAAALAAIREGGAKPASRGRGRGGARPEPALVESMAPGTEEPPEPVVAADGTTAAATGEARRRRRRRGGRGRGRGRARTDEAGASTAAPAADGEVGWTELEDASAGLPDADEVREYSFEEADAATLAELGLLPGDEGVAAMTAEVAVEAPAAEAPKPRRGRKPAEGAQPEEAETPKPSRGRSRAAGTKAAPAKGTEGSVTRKPRSRTAKPKATGESDSAAPKAPTKTRAKAAAEPAPTEGAEEGIWQRFRGARSKAP